MKQQLDFLKRLAQNNHKEWFQAQKTEYEQLKKANKQFYEAIFSELAQQDNLENMHIHRMNNDLRFSKDKPPYKEYFGVAFSRQKPLLWGDYYISIEPNNSFVGGGFYAFEPQDLLRVRKEFEADTETIQKIVNEAKFKQYFGEIIGDDAVKTAPKGFDKNHPLIHLIRKKQLAAMRKFTDAEVCSSDFAVEVVKTFQALRPWLDYMSEILTTDLNGNPIN